MGELTALLWILVKFFLLFSAVWVVFTYLFKGPRDFARISSRWHHTFINEQFSTKEIYKAITEKINEKGIPELTIRTTRRSQGSMFDGRRVYLKVIWSDQLFLICAAPFGTGYFVSWWSGERQDPLRDVFVRIPWLGPALDRIASSKSYYQMDTETMFTAAIKNCVHQVIDELNGSKGLRGLTELEQRPISLLHQ